MEYSGIPSLLLTLRTHGLSSFDCISARQNVHLFPQCSHFFSQRVYRTNHIYILSLHSLIPPVLALERLRIRSEVCQCWDSGPVSKGNLLHPSI